MAENTGNKVEIKRQATRKSKIPRRLLSPKPWNQYTGLDPTLSDFFSCKAISHTPSKFPVLAECLEKKTGTYIALPVFNRMEDSSI